LRDIFIGDQNGDGTTCCLCMHLCIVSRARVHDDDLQLAATTTADCGRQVNRGTIGDYYFSH